MEALDIALQTKMVTDTGAGKLATLSSGGIFQLTAPSTAPYPLTVWQELLDLPGYTFAALAYNSIAVQIKHLATDANTEGASIAGQMADRCRILLTDPSLTVGGKSVLYCRFIRGVPSFAEWIENLGKTVFSKGGIFEIWLA